MKLDLDNFTFLDGRAFEKFKNEYDEHFRQSYYNGATRDEHMDNDLEYLKVAFEFFFSRGYIK